MYQTPLYTIDSVSYLHATPFKTLNLLINNSICVVYNKISAISTLGDCQKFFPVKSEIVDFMKKFPLKWFIYAYYNE